MLETFYNLTEPSSFTVTCKISKIQNKRFYHGVTPPNDANGIANSEDPDYMLILEKSNLSLHCLASLSVREFRIITVKQI